jgi:hypothetical protein
MGPVIPSEPDSQPFVWSVDNHSGGPASPAFRGFGVFRGSKPFWLGVAKVRYEARP